MADDSIFRAGDIYRDTQDWYLDERGGKTISSALVEFCRQRAGKKILDYGCAVGNYCVELGKLGFECVGADVNPAYVEVARKKGVDAVCVKDVLPFPDRSFDTVIIFEVLEHAEDIDMILDQARRVARGNVLLTVPDNTQFAMLKKLGVTYEHMLDSGHRNFFTKTMLSELLARNFRQYTVTEREPICLHHAFPWYIRKPVTLFMEAGIIKPVAYNRLYAECFI